ncbi:hypothetical protein BDV3_000630 [Batrachochytrium dendrobatidis]|nr:hypothetical protein QVD99_001853 [Batrachochytrium dendrobatidis]
MPVCNSLSTVSNTNSEATLHHMALVKHNLKELPPLPKHELPAILEAVLLPASISDSIPNRIHENAYTNQFPSPRHTISSSAMLPDPTQFKTESIPYKANDQYQELEQQKPVAFEPLFPADGFECAVTELLTSAPYDRDKILSHHFGMVLALMRSK